MQIKKSAERDGCLSSDYTNSHTIPEKSFRKFWCPEQDRSYHGTYSTSTGLEKLFWKSPL